MQEADERKVSRRVGARYTLFTFLVMVGVQSPKDDNDNDFDSTIRN